MALPAAFSAVCTGARPAAAIDAYIPAGTGRDEDAMAAHQSPNTTPVTAVLFEPYGTLLDIETDERDWHVFLNLSRFLEYRGVSLTADELRWLWFEQLAKQVADGPGPYREVDVRAAWRVLLAQNQRRCELTAGIDTDVFLTDVVRLYRALTRRSLKVMDGVRPLLEALSSRLRLGILSDSQPDYVIPELHIAGIASYFETVTISGERGYRKPDPRLFHDALDALHTEPEHTLFIGVDTARDMAGARGAGIRSVLVLTPYGSKDLALGEPDEVIDRTDDLAGLIERLAGR